MYALIGLGLGLLSLRAARLVEAGPTPKYPFDLAADLPPQEVEVPVCPPTLRATQASRVLVTVRTPGDWSVRRKENPRPPVCPRCRRRTTPAASRRRASADPDRTPADQRHLPQRLQLPVPTRRGPAVQWRSHDRDRDRRSCSRCWPTLRNSAARSLRNCWTSAAVRTACWKIWQDIARAAYSGGRGHLIVDRAANESGSLDEAGNLDSG